MSSPTGLRRTTSPMPSATRPMPPHRRLARAALRPFWVVPALWCAAAVAAGLLLPRAEQGLDGIPLLLASGPDGARTLLSTIAGAMISVTGLVFSNVFVVLQLASSQFTPRLLRTFLDDRVVQHTLGVFAATFLYSLTVLRAVHDVTSVSPDADPRAGVPQLAVSASFVLVLAAVGMFLLFIHHVTSAIAVGSVVGRVGQECRTLVAQGREEAGALPDQAPSMSHLDRQVVATSPRSGYLDLVDRRRLCRLAGEHGGRVEVLHPLGTFVPEGAPLALVHLPGDTPTDAAWWSDRLVPVALGLSSERSSQQDLAFGVRRLVDIAERALSPGVNDPTTAVQVIDELHDLLRRLAATSDPYPVTLDDAGVPRVVTRERTFGDYLDLAVDEIAHYGRDSLQVPRRLEAMLDDVASVAPERRALVEAKRAEVRREQHG